MAKTNISQTRLKEILNYNPLTGGFTRLKQSINSGAKLGKIRNTPDHTGYIRIRIDGTKYLAHRLAILYMVGHFPVEVDHDNRVRTDNRFSNLNIVTRLGNSRNHSLQANNTSGFAGVTFRGSKWIVRISVEGERIELGRFTELSEAVKCRVDAESEYGFHVNHGQ